MRKIMILLLAVVISSCSCKKDASNKATVGSIEGNWELTSIPATKTSFESLYANAKPTISFNINETKVTGKNSCNSYGGNFSLDGMTLDIDEKTLFSTKMFCEGAGEKTFMDALGKVNAYKVSEDGNTLTLSTGKNAVMTFRKI